MSFYTVGARAAGAGSATLPCGSLYATAAVTPRIREIGISNTTAVAVTVGLCKLSATGTQGAALTEQSLDGSSPACAAFNTHTVTGALVDMGYRMTLGAAIGAGVIWTFGGDVGMTCNLGTSNGIGIYIPTGTGQVIDFYFVWNE